jgi:hypothetical protein
MKRLLVLAITASQLGAQRSAPTWTVSPAPTLYIGSETNTQTQFDGVMGIVRLAEGEIVVANGLSQEVRVFSASGEYLRTLTGGFGGMRSLDGIWRGAADTIYAAENLGSQNRIWIFPPAGPTTIKTVGASNAGSIYPVDRFPDGHFVVSAPARSPSRAPAGMTFIDSLLVGVVTLTDLSPKWIASLRNERLVLRQSPGRRGGRGGAVETVSYPYGRSTSFAVSGDRLWLGDSETGTITQYASNGKGLAVFSAPTPARPLDTALIKRVRSSMLSDAMNWSDRARIDAAYSLPFPRNAPRFTRFIPGVNGEMWIELFREDPAAPHSYVVLSRSGSPIGRATMPRRFRLLEVSARDIMGALTDDDGVEHVARYTLTRR